MAQATEKKERSEVKAYARGIHIAARKARLVADLLRKMSVTEALNQLKFINKKAVRPIEKLINSAVANAKHNFELDQERLFIKALSVDDGVVMERYKPRAQGRAFPIRRRTSNINLILGVSARPIPKAVKAKPVAKTEQPKPAENDEKKETKEQKRGWFKRGSSAEQSPTVGTHAKGKQQSFDRRGNM